MRLRNSFSPSSGPCRSPAPNSSCSEEEGSKRQASPVTAATRVSGEHLRLLSPPLTQGHMPWPGLWKRGAGRVLRSHLNLWQLGRAVPTDPEGTAQGGGAFRKGAPRRGDGLPAPLREAPASPRFHSARVTGDGSLGSGTEPVSGSALAAWEARPAPAASFTGLGDWQGDASMLI